MFVYPQRRKTQGAVALAVGALAIAACDDPTARTDLRPEGDPEVLAVLVLSDSLHGLLETATFCAPNDPIRPTLVGLPDFTTTTVCDEDPSVPATMAEAAPGSWYVRIMFDELLDPSIEDLIPILDENDMETGTFTGTLERTQPVTLRCKGVDDMFHDVAYDGYYSPSGNNVTWPVGPSIVIRPLDPTIVPVASDCEVAIKADTVKDKSGNFVPPGQVGPYKFRTQPVTVIDTFPADGGTVAADFMFLNDFEYIFNTVIDPDTFTLPEDVTLTPAEAGTAGTYGFDNLGFVFGNWTPGTEFTVEITADAMVTDLCGKETPLRVDLPSNATTFSTQPFRLNSITPAQGTGVLPSRKIRLDFNTPVDASTLATTEFTVTPAIAGMTVVNAGGDNGTLLIQGRYQLNTEYTFTLNANATVRDVYDTTDFTNAMDQTVKFTTATAIALTAQSPANDARVVKATTASNVDVRLTFSTEMDTTTLGTDEFTFTTAAGAPVAGAAVVPNAAPSTGVAVRVVGLAAGSYVFTLKAGATINDLLGNTYTQAADRVIPFTVAETPTPPDVEEFLCLGQTPSAAN
ncbi:MAG: Ig-like domain-containing protein [Deltaproteobacteria bacterium]|nr:Ig-like domain-containing protein [Deltaproteobacteria bacterium]MDQ3299497.1 Ig-like domain-containing protein [Myxococcota bacterium]